jgi:hypothetical protein
MSLVKIEGIDAVVRMLKDVAPAEGRRLLRDTVQDVAKQVVADAKATMPRDTGAMAAGTYARKEPLGGGLIRSTVRVRGAFYWRFLEYGDGPDGVEHAMFLRAKERMLSVLDRQFLDAFARRLVARLMKG